MAKPFLIPNSATAPTVNELFACMSGIFTILISGVENTIGRAYALNNNYHKATSYFKESIFNITGHNNYSLRLRNDKEMMRIKLALAIHEKSNEVNVKEPLTMKEALNK